MFVHPDDETTTSADTFSRYSHQGIHIYVAMATRGDNGGLGTEDLVIEPDEFHVVRESEL